MFILAGPLSAGASPWSFESVATHPRWLDLVRGIESSHLTPVPEGRLQAACRHALEARVTAEQDDPVSACIKSALQLLEGDSEYTDPKAYAQQQGSGARKFVGIGLELGLKDRGMPLPVVQPIHGAPGERAGILPKDRILTIDGVDIVPMSMDETIAVFRGEAGTVVRLTVQREGNSEPLLLSARRQEIRVLTARVKPLPGGLGYARISQFNRDTGESLSERVSALHLAGNKPPHGLVIDLRNNPGGVLDALVPVASVLAPPDMPIVAVMGRNTTDLLRTAANTGRPSSASPDGDPSRTWRENVPLVVLVNERTAGAAEALAQFLRETRGAKLLGTRTAGSIHVRTRQLIGGDAAVTLVTGRMKSTTGRSWTGGLTPDTVLEAQAGSYELGEATDQWMAQAVARLPTMRGTTSGPP